MFKKNLSNIFIKASIIAIFIFCNVLPLQAMAHEGVRDDPNSCNIPDSGVRAVNPCYTVNYNTVNSKCEVGKISFAAFLPLNRDIEWELFPLPGNHYCLAFVTIHVAALMAAREIGRISCANTGLTAALNAGTAIPGIGPHSLLTSALLASNCAASIAQCAAGNCVNTGPCCFSAISFAAILGIAVAEMAIIFAVAESFFNDSRICGYKWSGWQKEEITSTEETSRNPKWQASKGTYRKCIENIFKPGSHKTLTELGGESSAVNGGKVPAGTDCQSSSDKTKYGANKDIKSKAFREYTFGGIEFQDNGVNACKNPWTSGERLKILGYDSDIQRYYFKGSGEGNVPNFACYRYLIRSETDPTGEKSREAYDCCNNRSQEALCVEKGSNYTFCETGSICNLDSVKFEVFNGKSNGDYICAKTYSVCPYNVPVAGGTEIAKYDPVENYSDVKLNFCQHFNHCWKRPFKPTIKSSDFSGNYISSACYTMRGDSQNSYEYNAGLLPMVTRNFTAPFVQCFKETIHNVFFNLSGHTVCVDSKFNSLEKCGGDGNILIKEGDPLPNEQSFFKKIQDFYRDLFKMVMAFAIMMLGLSTLMAVPKLHLEKKVVMMFILKVGLVTYFVMGDAWQLGFGRLVLDFSSVSSEITFQDNLYNGQYNKLDGCQFPRYNYQLNKNMKDYSNPAYPPGKSYLKVWDTFDCKIIRALGFSGEISVPNILLIIVAGFFTNALGVIFFVATFAFGFLLISIAVRAMHIFLISNTAVVILLFISPFTITMAMFERTKKIFESWWKQLLGYSLQPLVLFIYLSMFISVFDAVLMGSATYSASTVKIDTEFLSKDMQKISDKEVVDNMGRIAEKKVDCSSGNAMNDSIYCIFNLPQFKQLSGFDLIGLGIPTLTNLTKEKLETIVKAALIMFIFLNFIDKMTTFASKLLGGPDVSSAMWNLKTSDMIGKLGGAMRAIQKRGMRGIKKHSLNVVRGGIGAMRGMRELARDYGDIKRAKNANQGAGAANPSANDDGSSAKWPEGLQDDKSDNKGSGKPDDHAQRSNLIGDHAQKSQPLDDHVSQSSNQAGDHASRGSNQAGDHPSRGSNQADDHASRAGGSSGGLQKPDDHASSSSQKAPALQRQNAIRSGKGNSALMQFGRQNAITSSGGGATNADQSSFLQSLASDPAIKQQIAKKAFQAMKAGAGNTSFSLVDKQTSNFDKLQDIKAQLIDGPNAQDSQNQGQTGKADDKAVGILKSILKKIAPQKTANQEKSVTFSGDTKSASADDQDLDDNFDRSNDDQLDSNSNDQDSSDFESRADAFDEPNSQSSSKARAGRKSALSSRSRQSGGLSKYGKAISAKSSAKRASSGISLASEGGISVSSGSISFGGDITPVSGSIDKVLFDTKPVSTKETASSSQKYSTTASREKVVDKTSSRAGISTSYAVTSDLAFARQSASTSASQAKVSDARESLAVSNSKSSDKTIPFDPMKSNVFTPQQISGKTSAKMSPAPTAPQDKSSQQSLPMQSAQQQALKEQQQPGFTKQDQQIPQSKAKSEPLLVQAFDPMQSASFSVGQIKEPPAMQSGSFAQLAPNLQSATISPEKLTTKEGQSSVKLTTSKTEIPLRERLKKDLKKKLAPSGYEADEEDIEEQDEEIIDQTKTNVERSIPRELVDPNKKS